MKVAQKPRGTARFRRHELVSVCGIWQWRRHSGLQSQRAFFGVSFLLCADAQVRVPAPWAESSGKFRFYMQRFESRRLSQPVRLKRRPRHKRREWSNRQLIRPAPLRRCRFDPTRAQQHHPIRTGSPAIWSFRHGQPETFRVRAVRTLTCSFRLDGCVGDRIRTGLCRNLRISKKHNGTRSALS